MDKELGWNDPIENDGNGGSFILLPEGNYPFEVVNLERRRFAGGAKLPPCNQATLTISLNGGDATVLHNLYLHTKTEGLLCAFFRAIGARKHGQSYAMDWGIVRGKTGMCHVRIRKWTGRDGEGRESNEIAYFIDPDDVHAVPATSNATPDEGPGY